MTSATPTLPNLGGENDPPPIEAETLNDSCFDKDVEDFRATQDGFETNASVGGLKLPLKLIVI